MLIKAPIATTHQRTAQPNPWCCSLLGADARGYARGRVASNRSTKNVYPRQLRMSTKNVDIRPTQCRAGRALLELTQSELAELAGLGLSTVVDFEKGRRQVSMEAVKGIEEALKRAGVDFIDENGG